jgi:hypothetical protein
MKKWNPKERPDTGICPREFCFLWVCAGGRADLSGKEYDSAQEAIAAAKRGTLFPEGGCGSFAGTCTRQDAENGVADMYEPHEPNLKKAGLPWFYFTDRESLADERRDQFDKESAEWWRDV